MKMVLRYSLIFRKSVNTLKVLIQVDLLEIAYHYKFFETAFPRYLTKFYDWYDKLYGRMGFNETKKTRPSLDRRKC